MSLLDSNHPAWNAITLAIAGLIAVGVLALRMAFAYNNGFDFEKDTATIFVQVGAFVVAVGGSAAIKRLVGHGSH
jgi:hypothetical protein